MVIVIGATVNEDGTFDLTIDNGTTITLVPKIKVESLETNGKSMSIVIKGTLIR